MPDQPGVPQERPGSTGADDLAIPGGEDDPGSPACIGTPDRPGVPQRPWSTGAVRFKELAPGKTFRYPLLQSMSSKSMSSGSFIQFLVESRPKGMCVPFAELFRRGLLHSHIIRMVLSKQRSLGGGRRGANGLRRCSQACSPGTILHIVCKFTQLVTTHLWTYFAVVRRRK